MRGRPPQTPGVLTIRMRSAGCSTAGVIRPAPSCECGSKCVPYRSSYSGTGRSINPVPHPQLGPRSRDYVSTTCRATAPTTRSRSPSFRKPGPYATRPGDVLRWPPLSRSPCTAWFFDAFQILWGADESDRRCRDRGLHPRLHGAGGWIGKGEQGLKGYFLGERNMPAWAVMISIVATETSTVTFLSVPGEAYRGRTSSSSSCRWATWSAG